MNGVFDTLAKNHVHTETDVMFKEALASDVHIQMLGPNNDGATSTVPVSIRGTVCDLDTCAPQVINGYFFHTKYIWC